MKTSGEIPWLPDKFVVLRGGAPVLHTLLLMTRDHVRLRFYLGNQDIPRDCVRSSQPGPPQSRKACDPDAVRPHFPQVHLTTSSSERLRQAPMLPKLHSYPHMWGPREVRADMGKGRKRSSLTAEALFAPLSKSLILR